MTTYEILSIVLAGVALIVAIPAMILSLRQTLKMNFKIAFHPEGDSVVTLRKTDNGFYCNSRFEIRNKSDQDCTIIKVIVVDGIAEEQLIIANNGHYSAMFENVRFLGNSVISNMFSFEISSLPKRYLTFKVYANRKTFTFKSKYLLVETQKK